MHLLTAPLPTPCSLPSLAPTIMSIPCRQSMMLNPPTAPSDNIGRLATAVRQDRSPAISQGAEAVNPVSRSVSRIAYLAYIVGGAWVGAWVVGVGLEVWFLGATMNAINEALRRCTYPTVAYADHDHDMLRAFFDTTAKDDKLLKLVLKKTKGKDLSDPHYNQVRAAIEHCRSLAEA